MGELMKVEFYGTELLGLKRGDQVFVPLKPAVEAMGLEWSGQLQRLKRSPILHEGMVVIPIPFGPGGVQEMLCLPLDDRLDPDQGRGCAIPGRALTARMPSMGLNWEPEKKEFSANLFPKEPP